MKDALKDLGIMFAALVVALANREVILRAMQFDHLRAGPAARIIACELCAGRN